jgi:hypothetical protein
VILFSPLNQCAEQWVEEGNKKMAAE